ncbi:MAG: hypothetical protein HQL82_02405 [Magnetococcales bacterium]|nr:hypothetical protein [Magnetococcales bacterium]
MSPPHGGTGRPPSILLSTLALGLASGGLYLLLYLFADRLTEYATLIHQGQKGYVVIPIGIALVFSFVHGAFTGRFWDLMGLKAKK